MITLIREIRPIYGVLLILTLEYLYDQRDMSRYPDSTELTSQRVIATLIPNRPI